MYRAKYIGVMEHLQGQWALIFPRTGFVKAMFEDQGLLLSMTFSGFQYDDFTDWQEYK